MEISGFSTDFTVDSSFPERVARFVRAQRGRWPSLYFCGAPAAESLDADWRPDADPGQEHPEILTFSGGPVMEEFWEEHGYALDGSGQGPFSVLYRFHRSPVGARLGGVRTRDRAAAAAAEGTELLMPAFFLVSLVTPADPDRDGFSRSVLRDFRRCFED
ncbi:hypothetical protein [Kitasatospora sp. NPDC057198]|uniref:hypothetical protein n=1 Tax=Kitasatospora sp. NPDC057198 TaxID=3346046 RepID=UPI00363DD67D